MWLIRLAMTRPVTIMVAVATVVILSILALTRMKVDIFPQLDMPRITVIQPYGGMDPAQMEGYIVTFYEQHFFYISGVDHVASRSIQSAAVMDVYFQPGTDMADAMAQVVAQVERSRAYMPPGTVTPFILRFDVGNVPVGFLVFSSETRNVGEIQDLVYARVRPVVSTIPGVSTPPPFGGNQRSIVITVDSHRLSEYHLSVDDIVQAINQGNTIMPSGVVRTGNLQRMSVINSVVTNVQDLGLIPVKEGAEGTAVYLRDIAKVEDTTDILTGYALVNGRRTVYMAISKQAAASTLDVVNGIKRQIAYMQSLLPGDIKVSFEFDQSVYVTEAIKGLVFEGGLGAILTGTCIFIFLHDLRSSLIVILSIPSSLLGAVVGLWIGGQSTNIMTLSGLALAVGILVDEGTVVIENIHSHMAQGVGLLKAIYDASIEVVVPRLLAMLSVISVFMPSFFMTGITRSLFVPLSMAVGLAMFCSYILSGTFVPVLAAWILKPHPHKPGQHGAHAQLDFMGKLKIQYQRLLILLMKRRAAIIAGFALLGLSTAAIYPTLGSEIFPAGNPTGFQLRIKAPTGTRFEVTEDITKQVLRLIAEDAGRRNLEVSIGYVGTQPPSYAVSNVYMWTSGPQEAVLLVSFREEAKIQIKQLEERLRVQLKNQFPELSFTFEAGDIVNKILNFGSATPIQVDINGPKFDDDQAYSTKLLKEMKKLPQLRDVGIVQPLDYPTLDVVVDRVRAGELGVNVHEIGRALVASTYSSRFVTPVYWRDPKSGLSYQVQVEVPQGQVGSLEQVGNIPVKTGSFAGPFVHDVSQLHYGTMPGEYDHYNMSRMISIAANLATDDLGGAAARVQKAIDSLGKPPRGVKVSLRGQVPVMRDTFLALGLGVIFAVVSIFLLLVSFFQTVRLALTIISVIPAIIFGAVLALAVSHTTINVQSFMGTIMATGVGVANSILVCVFAEERRMLGLSARTAAVTGAAARLRPVVMTSLAMIFGMIPMALGMSEGGERTAPLGRAVIGGLLCSTASVLLVLPLIYSLVQKNSSRKGASVLPAELEAERGSAWQGACYTRMRNPDMNTSVKRKLGFGPTLAVALSVVTVLGLSSCSGGGTEGDKAVSLDKEKPEASSSGTAGGSTEAEGSAIPAVPVVKVEKRTLESKLDLPGQLLAYQDVPLHSKVEGYISWIGVDRGSVVHKGQLLIKVTAPEVDASVREAEAKQSAAEAAYRQAVSAYQSIVSKQAEAKAKLEADSLTWSRLLEAAKTPGAIAQNDVDLAAKTVEEDKARVDSLKAEISAADHVVSAQKDNLKAAQHVVDSMKAMRAYLEIRAPFDGVITERNVHEGSIVSVSPTRKEESEVPLLRIQQKNLLRLVVAVPEACVAGCEPGKKIPFTVPAFPGKEFYGKVARLGFALDQKTRTMPVEMDVPNASGELEPGMFATVKWDVTRPYATLFAPASAVGDDLKGTFVVKVNDGVAQRVAVSRGQQMDNLVEIVGGGIKEGDELTLKATNEFKTGMHIKAKIADAATIEKAAHHASAGGE